MQDKQDNSTSQAQHQQALDEARVALDASYHADLNDPFYSEHRRISQRTHKLWLAWSSLQLSTNMQSPNGERIQSQEKQHD